MSRIYGEALGEEALYRGKGGKNMILGPGVNIYRTPLNGRNFEYMGEDPFLASIMVAKIRSWQASWWCRISRDCSLRAYQPA